MKILILESSMGLSNEMENFVKALNMQGHYTIVIDNCYERLHVIRNLLSDDCPRAIAFLTTFVYSKRFTKMFELAPLINSPVFLLDLNGKYVNDTIANYIPSEHKHKFTVCEFNPLNVTSHVQTLDEILASQRK